MGGRRKNGFQQDHACIFMCDVIIGYLPISPRDYTPGQEQSSCFEGASMVPIQFNSSRHNSMKHLLGLHTQLQPNNASTLYPVVSRKDLSNNHLSKHSCKHDRNMMTMVKEKGRQQNTTQYPQTDSYEPFITTR